jgi:hypothetical protein
VGPGCTPAGARCAPWALGARRREHAALRGPRVHAGGSMLRSGRPADQRAPSVVAGMLGQAADWQGAATLTGRDRARVELADSHPNAAHNVRRSSNRSVSERPTPISPGS